MVNVWNHLDALSRIIEILNTRLGIIGGYARHSKHPNVDVILQQCQQCLSEVLEIRDKEVLMVTCPDPKCQEDQTEMKAILFKDTEGGIRYDIRGLDRKKVSWKALATVASLLLILFGIFYASERQTRVDVANTFKGLITANTDNIILNTKTINVLASQRETLSTNIDWIKKSLERLEDKKKGFVSSSQGAYNAIPK